MENLFPFFQNLCTAYVSIAIGKAALERVSGLGQGIPLFIDSGNSMWEMRTDEYVRKWPTRGEHPYRADLDRQRAFEEVNQMSEPLASATDPVSPHDLTRGDFLSVMRRKQWPSGLGWFYG